MWTGVGVVLGTSSWSLSSLLQMDGGYLIANIVIIFLIFIWIVSIVRVARDVMHRTNFFGTQIISILLVTLFTPLVGLPLYFVIRPISYKKDRIPRREACASTMIHCYNCGTLNAKEYLCCIACGERLKIKCKECGNSYPHSFSYCNICGAPNVE